jgi:hypothetical protein
MSFSTEVTPARGDDEKHACDRQGAPRDDRPLGGEAEGGYLRRHQPYSREKDEQESDFRQHDAGLMRQAA